jgi:hypothetical protein
VLAEDLEDLVDVLLMIGFVSTVDQDVVDVHNDTDVQEGFQDILNQGLESGWGIGESKGHDLELVMAIVGMECSLLDVILVDSNLVVSPSKVNLGEDGCSLKSVNQIINEGDGESVLLGDFVECMIIDAHLEFSILLLDKNDWGTIGR